MHAPNPQQQPEQRPATVAGFISFFWRKLKQALRPTNPFRTAKGIAVTGPGPTPSAITLTQPLSAVTPSLPRAGHVHDAHDGPSF